MITKHDIESDTTLEIDEDRPTPDQLATVIKAFETLLNGAYEEGADGETIQWGVQPKEGSTVLEYIPSCPANPEALAVLRDGLNHFEVSSEPPPKFTKSMISSLHSISEATKTKKNGGTSVQIWIAKKSIGISESKKANINKALKELKALKETFTEYGSVEGRLQILDSHAAYQFALYEPLHNKKIICIADDRVSQDAHGLWNRRVEAEGMIKYSSDGLPSEIRVEKLSALPSSSDLPDYRETRGILKQYV